MSNSTGNSHGCNAGGGGGGGGGGVGSGGGSGSNFGSIGFGTFSIGASHGGSMVSVGSNTSSHGTSSNEMATHSFESRIDKMRRFISSPLTRRKSTSQASTESAPPLSTTSSSKNIESQHTNKIFGTPIEKLTHQRSFNEMSSSSICSSSTHLSASSYCTMRSMSTSGLPGNPFSSPSSSSSLSSSTTNMGDPMIFGQTSLLSSSRKVDSEQTVPFVITRLCHYIEDSQGLMQEGLFRTSGNARLIEKLKTSFDSNGDAPLETEGDIPSAAALLKLFLRELPVPLIPQSIHCLFLDTVQDTLNQGSLYNKDAFIGRLKMLVQNLPDENYFLLKYLSRFLHQVARHETYNRMNPSSLGIIFGPNIFRVAAEDYKGLREQSLTNQVVTFFITDYEAIFGKDSPDNEESTNLLTNQDQHSLDINQENQLTLEETQKLEGNTKDKVIVVSIESDNLHQMTGKHLGESSFCSLSSSSSPSNKTIMTKEDDVNSLDNVSAKAAEINLSGDDHYTPLQIDIPPIDCEPSDSSSISPNTFACSSISPCPVDSKEYLLSIDSSESTATLPTITPQKSQHQSSEGFKRKDRKSVLSSSSPVMRSSSEERKRFAFPDQMESNQANQDVRRCNSYQDVSKDGEKQTSFLSDQQQQAFKSNNLSSDSVTQSPRPKRRETESVKARLSRSTLSFECRPTTLDLSGRSNSMESKSEPMMRNKSSHIYTENSSTKPIALNEQSVEENKSKYIPLSISKSYSKGSQQTKTETSHPNVENRQILSCQSSQQPEPDLSRASSSSKKPHTSSSLHSSLPHIDLNALHKNAEGESAMVSDLRYSWSSAIESLSIESLLETGDDDADDDYDTSETQSDPRLLEAKSNEPVQNAAIQILRRRNTYEAPLSPSAYRGFLGQRAPHLDHTIPPSPPGEQEQHFHVHKASYNNESQAVKEAKRKIHNLKRRLKQFEKDFEKETGYRPSHEQKMKSDVAQPILFELNKFRKILRECKEDARLTLEFYEGVFNEMQKSLKQRRCVVGRPETIEDMSIDQIFEEKLDLQKSLLKYESVFGRPSRKEDRIVMKPLYDRYRTIRNLVAKIPKNKADPDLQPILENVAMNFSSPSHSPGSSVDAKDEDDEDINNNNQKKLDRSKGGKKGDDSEDGDDEDDEDSYDQENSNNNANLNSNNVNSDDNNNQVVVDNNNPSKFELSDNVTRTQPRPEATHSIKVKESSLSRYTKVSTLAGEKLTVPISSHKLCHNLHELPPSELAKELAVVRREKNELRKIIRSFEDEFHRNHGRKVNDIEKSQLDSVYNNYKACKKKLRLLEVFIEKYEKRKMDS